MRRFLPWLGSVGVVAAAFVARAQCTGELFPERTSFIETIALDLAFGDLDGDGDEDLLAALPDAGSLALLLLQSDGSYAPAIEIEVGEWTPSVVVGDLDGDGDIDAVVGDGDRRSLVVLWNSGSGEFDASAEYAAGTASAYAQLGDLDADGDLDVVFGDSGPDPYRALINDGAGVFTNQPLDLGDGQGSIRRLVDLNGDGHLDLLLTQYSEQKLATFLGGGDLTFTSGPVVDLPAKPYRLTINDFNLDGTPDVALSLNGGEHVAVLMGLGDGGFTAATLYPIEPEEGEINSGDLNRDGAADIIVACDYESDVLCVLLNKGDGTFHPADRYWSRNHPRAIGLTDVNGDGHPEIVLSRHSFELISVIEADRHGRLRMARRYPQIDYVERILTHDLNRDGSLDLLMLRGRHGIGVIGVLRGVVGGTFAQSLHQTVSLDTAASMRLADLDNDGLTDVLVSQTDTDTIAFLRAQPLSGNLVIEGEVELPFPANDFACGDLDADGDEDLVVVGGYKWMQVHWNRGNGDLVAGGLLEAGLQPSHVALSDHDLDGDLDVVLTLGVELSELIVFLNDGQGEFAPGPNHAMEAYPGEVHVRDMNRDGHPDYIVEYPDRDELRVLVSDGQGGHPGQWHVPVPKGLRSLAIAELNGDAWLDLVVGGIGNVSDPTLHYAVAVLYGQAEGVFASPLPYLSSPSSVVLAADLDEDGHMDLVSAGNYPYGSQSAVTVLLNSCNPCPGDVNDDGRTDQADLGLLLASYELSPGDPYFDPDADLNGDGAVGQQDLGILLADYECGL